MIRICSKCGVPKEENIDNFYSLGKLNLHKFRSVCKTCCLFDKKQKRVANLSLFLEREKNYRKNNLDKRKRSNKNYRVKNAIREKARLAEYRLTSKDKINEHRRSYSSNRRKSDLLYRLRSVVSISVARELRKNGSSKTGSILQFLPYDISELKLYLEKQFEPWMNWDNYGKYSAKTWNDSDPTTWTWQIDHIVPHSVFQYTSMQDESFKKCWDLSNLRPLSSKINILDGISRIRHK